jgi:hypothetical protein
MIHGTCSSRTRNPRRASYDRHSAPPAHPRPCVTDPPCRPAHPAPAAELHAAPRDPRRIRAVPTASCPGPDPSWNRTPEAILGHQTCHPTENKASQRSTLDFPRSAQPLYAEMDLTMTEPTPTRAPGRHRYTVGRGVPTLAAMSATDTPSSRRNTNSARQATDPS